MTAMLKFALFLIMAAAPFKGADWISYLSSAKYRAQAEAKEILVFFTGSDWCEDCQTLAQEALNQEAFVDGIKDDFVFLRVDFPAQKVLSENLKKQNRGLRAKFRVKNLPTVLLLDAQGRAYFEVDYYGGGVEAFLPEFERAKVTQALRDSKLEAAEQAGNTKERLKHLHAALEIVYGQLEHLIGYDSIIEEILNEDPRNELPFTGFYRCLKRWDRMASASFRKGYEQVLKLNEDFEDDFGFCSNELKQKILVLVGESHLALSNKGDASTFFMKARSVDPRSKIGKGLKMMIDDLRQ